MENKLWYAVMADNNDDDWGTGSYNETEARTMVKTLKEMGHEEAYIAVINEGYSEDDEWNDPICIEEIRED